MVYFCVILEKYSYWKYYMRIAMIGQKGYPAHYGGVEKHVAEISQRLVSIGHDVTVYNRAWYGTNSNGLFDGVQVHTLPTIHTKHLDTIVHTFLATMNALFSGYDVIHYHGVGPSLLSFIPRIFSKAKVVTTFHCVDRHHQKWGIFARTMLRIGEKAACSFAHETITVSKSLQQYCRNEFYKETTYIPNGVTMPISEQTNSTDVLDTYGLVRNEYILMVSRLVPHKGAHVLIEAFQRLKNEEKHNERIQNLKLIIVGGSAYTDDYVRSLHAQAGMLNDIVFTDFQSGKTIDALFRGTTLLVHPSMNEGLPITVLEAMSYEKPVMVSTIPEHLELITDPRFLVEENNVYALCHKLKQFIELDSDTVQRVGQKNALNVAEHYHWDSIVPELIKVYQQPKKNECSIHTLQTKHSVHA